MRTSIVSKVFLRPVPLSGDILSIQLRHQSDDLITWTYSAEASETLIVCFSGIGKTTDAAQPFEFAKTASMGGMHNVLYISDPRRTWLNGTGLIEKIVRQIELFRSECGAHRVVMAGHSLGGFSALVLPAFTQAHAVLAFAPQLSVKPELVPDEKRWQVWRSKISSFNIESAANHLVDTPNYTVIFGRHGREAPQRDRFPRRDNMRVYVMPQTHHNVPQRLKNKGILDKVFQFVIEGKPRKLRLLLQSKVSAELLP